jgi:cysteine desulfurase
MAIYLDNSATTCVRQEVLDAMEPFLTNDWGNSSSLHKFGRRARKAVEEARQQVAGLLNCSPEEIYFTPCGTHSNNAAIIGMARSLEEKGDRRRHLITTAIEHPSCLGPARYLEGQGWRVTYLPVDSEGIVRQAVLDRHLKDDTAMISIMWANNEIGSLQPIEEFAALAAERGIHFHTDAVQVAGRLPIDLSQVQVDTLALSGHKFYAPKGIGVLFVRKGVELRPLIFGGGQERGLTPGTEPVPNIVAIGKAAQLAGEELAETGARLHELQRLLFEGISRLPEIRTTGPHDLKQRLPGHVSFVHRELEGEALVLKMDLQGLMASSASACHKGIIEPSHVVMATGIPREEARGSIRMSVGRYNTEEECRQALEIFENVVNSLRRSNKTTAG